jgi:hypothetical protein
VAHNDWEGWHVVDGALLCEGYFEHVLDEQQGSNA